MKINFYKKILNLISEDKRDDLTSIFPKENFQQILEIDKYPNLSTLVNDNIYAYSLFFYTDINHTQKVIDVINKNFNSNIELKDAKDIVISSSQEAVTFNFYNDFSAEVLRLVTNSEKTIKEIWNLNISPPAPWVSFPEIDPDGLGSMQGNLSFWWDWMWLPFWNSMNKDQKDKYLIENSAPASWVEYFDFYDAHINAKKT